MFSLISCSHLQSVWRTHQYFCRTQSDEMVFRLSGPAGFLDQYARVRCSCGGLCCTNGESGLQECVRTKPFCACIQPDYCWLQSVANIAVLSRAASIGSEPWTLEGACTCSTFVRLVILGGRASHRCTDTVTTTTTTTTTHYHTKHRATTIPL